MSIYVTKPFLPPIDEYNKYTQDIFSRNILTNQGPCVVDFETKMKDFLSVKNFFRTPPETCLSLPGKRYIISEKRKGTDKDADTPKQGDDLYEKRTYQTR